MTLENIAKNYILKPAIGLALIGSMYGCSNEPRNGYAKTNESFPQETKSFERFESKRSGNVPVTQIRTGDFDGDGDLDFVVGYDGLGRIEIWENKIPQKNKLMQ